MEQGRAPTVREQKHTARRNRAAGLTDLEGHATRMAGRGYSLRQIAEALSQPYETVRNAVRQGRRKLLTHEARKEARDVIAMCRGDKQEEILRVTGVAENGEWNWEMVSIFRRPAGMDHGPVTDLKGKPVAPRPRLVTEDALILGRL